MKHFNIWGWIENADSLLLNKFQKFADKIQLNLGINCFGMARLTLFAFLLATGIEMMALGKRSETRIEIFSVLLFIYYYTRIEWGIRKVETSSANPIFSNPNAYEFALSRQVLLLATGIILPLLPLIAPILKPIIEPIGRLLFGERKLAHTIEDRFLDRIILIILNLRYLLIGVAMYFMCCNPKPPSESRLAKYLRSKSGIKTQDF